MNTQQTLCFFHHATTSNTFWRRFSHVCLTIFWQRSNKLTNQWRKDSFRQHLKNSLCFCRKFKIKKVLLKISWESYWLFSYKSFKLIVRMANKEKTCFFGYFSFSKCSKHHLEGFITMTVSPFWPYFSHQLCHAPSVFSFLPSSIS